MLSNPVYAGAYAYGKSRTEQFVDEQGLVRKRIRMLPRGQWAVLIPGHHQGYIDWPTFEANQQRLGTNTRPQPHKPGGALREGAALLQGLATCGHCARKLRTHYRGQQQAPGYHCANKNVVDGRGVYCLNETRPSAAIARWTRTIVWSRAASRHSGSTVCVPSSKRKPNSRNASSSERIR